MNPATVLLPFSAFLALLYLFGWPRRRPAGLDMPRMAVKAGSVMLLAVFALLAQAPWLLVSALAFGAVGDAFLVHDGKRAFIGGLASFLISHLLYAALFWPGTGPAALWGSLSMSILSLALLLGAAILLGLVWRGAEGLHLPVLLYAAAILGMCLGAVATGRPGLILGALLFFASDAVLSLEKFRLAPDAPALRLAKPFIWTSYYLAQLLIMLAWLSGR